MAHPLLFRLNDMLRYFRTASNKASLKAGSITNWIAFAVQLVCTFLLTPLVISHVGKVGYGIWVLVNSFSGYYGLVNLGLSSALIRFISVHSSRGEHAELRQVVATAHAFFLSTGALVVAAAFLFADPLAVFFDSGGGQDPAFVNVLRLLAVATAFDFIGVVTSALLNAHERFVIMGVFNIVRTLARFALTALFLKIGLGIEGLGWSTAIMSIVFVLSNAVLVSRFHGAGILALRGANFAMLWKLLRYGLSTFLMNLVNLARTRLGHVVLAKISGVGAVALFGLASSVVMQFNGMLGTTVSVLTTRFARLDAKGELSEIRFLFRKTLFICSMISFGVGLLIFLFGERFVHLWVGAQFADAVPAMHLLTLGYVLALSQSSGWNLMFGLDKHHFMAVTSLIELVVIVGCSVWLAQDYGATGVAAATAAGMILTKVLVQPIYIARLLKMDLRSYLTPIASPAGSALIIGISGWWLGMPKFLMQCSFLMWIVAGSLTAAIYVVLTLSCVSTKAFFVNPFPRLTLLTLRARKA